jgi:hypothetical protein
MRSLRKLQVRHSRQKSFWREFANRVTSFAGGEAAGCVFGANPPKRPDKAECNVVARRDRSERRYAGRDRDLPSYH